MSVDPNGEDIAAAAAEGDLVSYLLALGGRSRKRASEPVLEEPTSIVPTSPLHRPGAWPAGTRPTDANTCHPNCDCALTRRPPGTAP